MVLQKKKVEVSNQQNQRWEKNNWKETNAKAKVTVFNLLYGIISGVVMFAAQPSYQAEASTLVGRLCSSQSEAMTESGKPRIASSDGTNK